MLGFDTDKRLQRENKLRQYRQDLEEAKRQFFKIQEKYITSKNKETIMGANLEEVVTTLIEICILYNGYRKYMRVDRD